jgi:hypothetical protein
MRAFRLVVSVAAIILVGASVGKSLLAADRPLGGPEPPVRGSTTPKLPGSEGPKERGKKQSTKCKTSKGICTIKPALPVGSACSCPGPDGAAAPGKVEE